MKKAIFFYLTLISCCFIFSIIACNESCDCQNGGICIDGTCHCPEGFTGPDCSQLACEKSCRNGGECIDGTCKCVPGWTGPTCDTPDNACLGIFCQNGAICQNGNCICPPGCFGTYCENCVETKSFLPEAQIRLCPDLTSGDNNFDCQGPKEFASAKLYIVDNKEIWVKIIFNLNQTRAIPFNPLSEGNGEWDKRIWRAPSNYKIHAILSDTQSSCSGTDNGLEVNHYELPANELVDRFSINGDTPGADLGGCLEDDTYLSVFFHTVKVGILPE